MPDKEIVKAADSENDQFPQSSEQTYKQLLGARRSSSDDLHIRTVDAPQEQMVRWLDAISRLAYADQYTLGYIERSFRIFKKSLGKTNFGEAITEISGSVMDWLGTMRTALAHWERRLRRTHDEVPFLAACRHEYDRVFACRFLYRLRNYAQHLALPVHTLSGSKSGWILYVDRDALLEQYDGWSTVRDELEAGPGQINLEPLIRTCMESLRRIAQVVAWHDAQDLDQALIDLEECADYFSNNYGTEFEPIIYSTPDNGPPLSVGSTINLEPTPTWDRLREIGHRARELARQP